MNGQMHAYGSWDARGSEKQDLGKGKKEVRVYNPNGKVDSKLNSLLTNHVNALTTLESEMTPSCFQARKQIADKHDPQKNHRITPVSDAFSCTVSANYVTDPHDDSGVSGVLEFIQFVNTNGPLPDGHSWNFVMGGCILALPNKVSKSVVIALPASGVYHGTLPTSSTEDTDRHGNYGSALITKSLTVHGLKRQLQNEKSTGAKYHSSKLYSKKPSDEEHVMQVTQKKTAKKHLYMKPLKAPIQKKSPILKYMLPVEI